MTAKTKLVSATAALLALGGGGAALAAAGHGHAPGRAASRATGMPGHPGPGAQLQAAADYLGISVATLKADLQSGETLAQVADSTGGKSASGLISALVASEKSKLDAAVAAGKLTQAQEDKLTANLQQRVTALVDGSRPARPFARPGLGRGADLKAALDYLGISVATLKADRSRARRWRRSPTRRAASRRAG
jgi:hypothetical protein